MSVAHPQLLQRPTKSASWLNILIFILPVFAVIGIVAQINLVAAGLLYIPFFLVLSFARPDIALLLAFSLAPFVQDISIGGPFRFSIGELSLVLSIPAFLVMAIQRLRVPPFLWMVGAYIGVCIASTVVNRDIEGITPILQMIIYLVIAVIVFSTFVPNVFKFAMVIDGAMIVMAGLALSGILSDMTFPAMHKNAWGAGLSSGVVLTVELWMAAKQKRRRFLLSIAMCLMCAALLFSLSRGGWLAAMSGTAIIMVLRRQIRRLIRLLVLLLPLMTILWYSLPAQDREYATGVTSDRQNIMARYQTIENARQQFNDHPILGVGASYRKEVDATNIVMISLAESGIVGLSAFVAMHGFLIWSMLSTLKKVDRASFLYSPVALATALPIARLAHGCVDHYWSRGSLLQTWGMVGMAMAVRAYVAKQTAREIST